MENYPAYFADSAHPQHQTQKEGGRKEVATTAYQKRVNFIGGICLSEHCFICHQADKVNANSICSFLWKLRQANPGKFYVHVVGAMLDIIEKKLMNSLF